MTKNRWILLLGIGLPLILCLYLAICGMVGFFWGRTMEDVEARPINDSVEPTPVVTPVLRQPRPVESETAKLVTAANIPERDLVDLAHRFQGLPRPFTWQPPDNPPGYEIGDSLVLWVHDVRIDSYFTSTAILSYETPHAYWWIEEGYEVDADDLESSGELFEDITYPTSREFFGSEWSPGVDGDPHVYIFLGNVPGVGGYFSGPDESPVAVRPHSNEHEMFYINLENAGPGNSYFDGVLAHEFQHMIHWYQDRNERTWVNEGLSELSAQVGGYDVGGSDWMFTQKPDTQLNAWTELEDSAAHYGASYLFLSYFWEQYGTDAVRQLVTEQANGIAGFDTLLAELDPGRTFEDLFADWVVANYLDDPKRDKGQYGYIELRIDELMISDRHRNYPVSDQKSVHQYAADYIILEGDGDLTIEFTGAPVVSLVDNETHSGDYQWWSNRGDDGDARLTRGIDLTAVDSATLEVWMWYDLELDYDYGYVAVSTDRGETWDLLTSDSTTTENPNGNSYGAALTGMSGGGLAPEWSLETFDLTPYTGQQILLRFEVVTDEALNHPGLMVDDISIPELGYHDDVELGDAGWLAEGWLRVADHIPQDYIVQVITIGRETHVERLPLDEQQRGTFHITGLGQDIDRAVLVVSALAPATTEWATYSYQITQE